LNRQSPARLALRVTLPALAAGLALASASPVHADEAVALPPAAQVAAVLTQTPAYQAALLMQDAERSVQQQLRAGPHEWTGIVSAARRTQRNPASEQTQEWDVGLDRALRLPGKNSAYEGAGSARVAMAHAALHKAWREQARALLERHGAWLREREAARVWAEQAALMQRQLEAVARRLELGDAAKLDRLQAEAISVQARVQADAAASRAAAAREGLLQAFPGLDLANATTLLAPPALPALPPLSEPDAKWIEAQRTHNPELALARSDADVAAAQQRVDQAETRPDPTLGVRVGQARSGAERFVGVVLSLPFGGDYRAAGAAAAAARASAAALRLADAERRAGTEATQRLREAQAAHALAAGSADAALRLVRLADSLQRSYQLGEGTLSEVVAARRQANEQRLAAAVGTVEAWIARHRLALEAGALWPEPTGEAPVSATASATAPARTAELASRAR
jgi:outer membrane protein TolC